MGIKGLMKVIREHAPGAIQVYQLNQVDGQEWRLAVDGYLNVHKSVTAIRSGGFDLENDRGEITSHILGTLQKVIGYVENGITPIYVFDGGRNELKSVARDERNARLVTALNGVDTYDPETPEFIRCYRDSYYVVEDDIVELRILLDLMGVPHFTSPFEADPLCVYLTTLEKDGERMVKGVISDDTDMIPLGAPFVFQQMSGQMRRKSKIEIIRLSRVISEMGLTGREQLVDLCVMLGTDYNKNVRNMGPVRSLEAIEKHGDLLTVLESKGVQDPQKSQMLAAAEYMRTEVANIQTNPDYQDVLEEIEEGLDLRLMKRAELADYLHRKHSFDMERVVQLLDRYELAQNTREITLPNETQSHTMGEKW